MSVSHAFTGTVATGSTSVAPSPGGTVASGHRSILVVGTKPDTATINTPASWTHVLTHSGGAGAQGADSGPGKIAVFVRDDAFSGAQTVSITSGNSSWGYISTYSKSLASWSSLSTASGTDTTGSSTGYSATMSSTPDWVGGDVVLGAFFVPTDAHATVTSFSITATGITGGATTLRVSPKATTGNDSGGAGGDRTSTTGTASAGPVVSASLTGAANTYGPAVVVRLRDLSGPPVVTGAAGLSAETSLASVDSVTVLATSALTSQTDSVVAGGIQLMGSAAVSADSSVSVSGAVELNSSVTATAEGTLSANGGVTALGGTALSGGTTFTSTEQNLVSGLTGLGAESALTGMALVTVMAGPTLAADGTVSVLGRAETFGVFTGSSESSLVAATEDGTEVTGSAALTSEGTTATTGHITVFADSGMSGSSDVLTDPAVQILGEFVGVGTTELHGESIIESSGEASLGGEGSLQAIELTGSSGGSASLSGSSELYFSWDMHLEFGNFKVTLGDLEGRWTLGALINL